MEKELTKDERKVLRKLADPRNNFHNLFYSSLAHDICMPADRVKEIAASLSGRGLIGILTDPAGGEYYGITAEGRAAL